MKLFEKYKLLKAIILADDITLYTPTAFNETYKIITKDYVIESVTILPHFEGEKSKYTISAINRRKNSSHTLSGRIAHLAAFLTNIKYAKTK